jgi:FkbM family methyltransferase
LGGSLGVVSRVIRSVIGPEAEHIVVEANPHLIGICRSNAVLAETPRRTRIIQGAVAYGAERVRFHSGCNAHEGWICGSTDSAEIEVETVTLASLAALLPPGGSFALVCDIEGAEFDVLEREGEIFQRVSRAIVEIHPKEFARRGRSEADFLALAAARGLQCISRDSHVLVFAGPGKA